VDITIIVLIGLGLLVLFGLGAFGVQSWREGERRAAAAGLVLAVALAPVLFLTALLPMSGRWIVIGLVGLLLACALILFLLPLGRVERGDDEPQDRIDERDIMFARARLEPGSPNYEAYYALRPENQASDDKTRLLPGLLSPQASEANFFASMATEASFGVCESLQDVVNGPVAQDRIEHDAGVMTSHIKGLASYWGARTTGVAGLQPYHVYSHIGRGPGEYGAPLTLDHRYAIAFTVEMDRDMVAAAPAAPTVMESARQYANAAQIAVQLAIFIRSLGYPARAHIDTNYRVVAPLVARDAGLGEIGRMGLLMTPELGPRVRLGVVTTDLPLVPDGRDEDTSALDFCRICEKCAENCPVRCIPFGDRQEIDGALRWRIDQDICFRYWCSVGTDCARCMSVCPYSHEDNLMHNLIRWGVRRSGFARRAVLWLDDLFYGPKPEPKPAPGWVPPK